MAAESRFSKERSETDTYILLGRVTKPHGIRGEVKIYAYSGQPENFVSYPVLLFGSAHDVSRRALRVRRIRVQKKQVIVQLEGYTNRNQAEALVGHEVWIRAAELEPLPADAYYLHELVGREMIGTDGGLIGRITGFLAGGAQEILVVQQGKEEYLVPLHAEFIVSLDDQQVRVDLPPGLLDINRQRAG